MCIDSKPNELRESEWECDAYRRVITIQVYVHGIIQACCFFCVEGINKLLAVLLVDHFP